MRVARFALLLLCLAMAVAALGDDARALRVAGEEKRQSRKYDEALQLFEKARDAATAGGDELERAHALVGIGHVKRMQSNYAETFAAFNEARTLFIDRKECRAAAEADFNIGMTHEMLGELSSALTLYNEARELAQGNDRWLADLQVRIGSAYTRLGRNREAMQQLREAQRLATATGNDGALAGALNGMALVHFGQGNVQLALHLQLKALDLQRGLRTNAAVSQTLNNIGNAYHRLGNLDKALETHHENLILNESLNYSRGIAGAKINIASILVDREKYDEAKPMLLDAVARLESVRDPRLVSAALDQLSRVYEYQGNIDLGIEAARRALNTGSEQWQDVYYPSARLGRLYRLQKRYGESRAELERAIAAVEEMRRHAATTDRQFFDRRSAAYAEMVALLVEQEQFEEALLYAERFKARMLVDVLRSGTDRVDKLMTAEEREREEALTKQIVALNRELTNGATAELRTKISSQVDKARLDYDAFCNEMQAVHPDFRVVRGELQPISLAVIMAKLQPGHAVVEYLVTDDVTFAFVITKSGLRVETIAAGSKELTRLADGFRDTLAARKLDFREPSRRLHDLLVAPLKLTESSWVVIPDGPLWNLPFQALLDSEGRYVAQRAAIVSAPSITAWREMIRVRGERTGAERGGLLALGNPAVDAVADDELTTRSRLAPLPAAEAEVKTLGKLYGEKSAVYVGGEATEERFKRDAARYRILHLASHGILNDQNPMYSYLALATPKGASKEDGFLEARELMEMDLGADLVVLSACDTARGTVAAGEGMIGLSWALFVARCPSQVLSQWKVDSVATSVLMRRFHANLQKGNLTKAEALRDAVGSLLASKEYRHPFYWASFIMLGDGGAAHPPA